MVAAGRSPHTAQVYTCQCIDCGESVTQVAMRFEDARRMTRKLGWTYGEDRRWKCPEHAVTVQAFAHVCIDCQAVDTQHAASVKDAQAQSRAAGWEYSKRAKTWRCPEHRLITRPTVPVKQWTKVNEAPIPARLSLSFLERQKAADAEYARIMAERKARDEALKEVVFAQGRRQLTPEQERAVSGRNRQVVGFRNAARGAA